MNADGPKFRDAVVALLEHYGSKCCTKFADDMV